MVAWRKEAVKGESASNRKHLGNDWERVAYRYEKDSATPEMLLSDVAEPVVLYIIRCVWLIPSLRPTVRGYGSRNVPGQDNQGVYSR